MKIVAKRTPYTRYADELKLDARGRVSDVRLREIAAACFFVDQALADPGGGPKAIGILASELTALVAEVQDSRRKGITCAPS